MILFLQLHSSISVWVKNCENLALPDDEKEKLDAFIDQMYEDIDNGNLR